MANKQNRKLAAILFADIVGYTSLMQKDEATANVLLEKFHNTLNTKVTHHQGQVINNYGDGCVCTFDSAVAAMNCAKEVQTIFQTEPKVPVRVGLHSGDVMFKDDNVFGDSVNIASRIESLGVAGAVLFSKQIKRHISNQKEFEVQSVGEFDFKNVEKTMEVFALANEGLVIPKREEMKGKLKQGSFYSNLSLARKGIIGIGILLLALVCYFYFTKKEDLASVGFEKTIAVLPLKNLNSSGDDFEYFSDGMTQEIIDELAKIDSFKVSAFTQSSFYKNQNKTSESIAEELKVNYIISGTSRIIDDSKRIILSIELFNPFTKERLWNGTFNEEMKDAYSIQTAVAKQIAFNLDITLSPPEEEALDRMNTTNGDAFRFFLHAKSEVAKLTPQGLMKSQQLLRDAIELDPNYVQAHTLLAWSYSLTGDPLLMPNAISAEETTNLIAPHLKKSIELDPNNSDIYLVQSATNLWVKNQLRDAEKDVELALRLNSWPRIPTNFCICTAVATYVALGDVEKAKSISHIAKKVDPGNIFIYWERGNMSMLEGNYEEAQSFFLKTVEELDIPYFNTFLGWSHFHGAEYEEALKYLNKAYDGEELPLLMTVAYLSNVHYLLGNFEKSDYYLQELIKRDAAGEHHINLYLSMIYSARKEVSKALNSLDMAWNKKEYGIAVTIGNDPVFKILYEEPQFITLRKNIQFYE
ncbi:MAG: adenylate/guanylate cyclase domain-containing protein [Saprospiraceae bacterium]